MRFTMNASASTSFSNDPFKDILEASVGCLGKQAIVPIHFIGIRYRLHLFDDSYLERHCQHRCEALTLPVWRWVGTGWIFAPYLSGLHFLRSARISDLPYDEQTSLLFGFLYFSCCWICWIDAMMMMDNIQAGADHRPNRNLHTGTMNRYTPLIGNISHFDLICPSNEAIHRPQRPSIIDSSTDASTTTSSITPQRINFTWA